MQEWGTGAGLAAFGFWLFIAACVVVGVWENIRRRDAAHETLRRIVESGQSLDAATTQRILRATASSRDLDRDLRIAGYIVLSITPGLVMLGWALSIYVPGEAELFYVLLGVSGLTLCLSIGLLAAASLVRRVYVDDGDTD